MIRINVGDFRLDSDEKKLILDILDTGRISEGVKVREFEDLWSAYIGTKYAVAMNSGTAALISGWSALLHKNKYSRLKRKVITSPITYIATSNALVLAGFEPVYVDIDLNTFGITPENIKARLESVEDPENYAAVNPVHLMGYPCDMDQINEIAKDYNLSVVEDSAQAHGSVYKNRKTGSMSSFSAFSFYVAHSFQAGEMGALNTDDIEIYNLARKLKANGRSCACRECRRHEKECPYLFLGGQDDDLRFTHDIIGYNFKTTELQAAFAISQIKKADEILNRRRSNVEYLNEGLNKFSAVLQLPIYNKNVSYLAYPIIIKDTRIISSRQLRQFLEKEDIETRPLFGCIPTQQPAYANLKHLYTDKLPNADYVGRNGFYIGCHQYLKKEDLERMIDIFEKVLGSV